LCARGRSTRRCADGSAAAARPFTVYVVCGGRSHAHRAHEFARVGDVLAAARAHFNLGAAPVALLDRRAEPRALEEERTLGHYRLAHNQELFIGAAPPARLCGKAGLGNLGNTCYFNSAAQCLLHTRVVARYFLENGEALPLNQENPLGMGGALAKAFSRVCSAM
jgi:hypothetical protein